jgi:putative membrane protein
MSDRDFFHERARRRAAESVQAIEAQTSAEVVVAVRPCSGDYRVLAYQLGMAAAGAVVLYMCVVPQPFTVASMALEAVVAFIAALVLSRAFRLARYVLPRNKLIARANAAARAAFYDLGISRTRGRTGILVYVSVFERTCTVLPDLEVPLSTMEPGFSEACARLDAAVRRRQLDRFFTELETLGPILGRSLPRAADDINELPDEVQ